MRCSGQRPSSVTAGRRWVRDLSCSPAGCKRSPEGIVHLVVDRIEDRSEELARLADGLLHRTLARADEVQHLQSDSRLPPRQHTHPRNVRVLPRSRDFH